jgi:tetratricopeptide (TPR) repeat protein
MNQELEQLHRDASSHYLKGEYEEAIRCWQRVLQQNPDDERATEGIRLCAQMALAQQAEAEPGAAAVERAADEEPLAFELSDPDQDEEASPPAPDATAADELQRRVEVLLDEAHSLLENGDKNGARRTLSRVLILDDVNATALSLMQAIDASEPSETPALELDVAEAVGEALELTDETAPESEPALELTDVAAPGSQPEPAEQAPLGEALELTLDGADEAPAESFEVSGNDAVPEPEPFEAMEPEPAEAPSELPDEPAPAPAAAKGLPVWARDRRVQLGAGGALLLVTVFGGMQMIGGGDGVSMEPLNAVANGSDPAKPEDPAPAPAAIPATVDLSALIADAEAAFERGDYGAAVIAYDKVLAEDPGHQEANASLKLAADRFQQQTEKQQRWDDAVSSFEEGHYAKSLRLLYRMADGDYEADLQRMRFNGWFNLGVDALKARDCPRAEENFREALGIDGQDAGALEGLELAEVCRGAKVVERISNLGYRQLND